MMVLTCRNVWGDNMNENTSRYRGEALNALKTINSTIGDVLQVQKENVTYNGILLPCPESQDGTHLILKLRSGYNIGVKITTKTKIEKTGEKTKVTHTLPRIPQEIEGLPKVALISTGGTIASRVDYRTGAVRPALTAEELYNIIPELSKLAQIETKVVFSVFSENLNVTHWKKIANTVAKEISHGVKGVIIAHGTDTMAYTAAALSFALQNLPIPVVLAGAQRSSDRPSSDAALNMIGAVITATKAPFAEIVVAMHETETDKAILLHKGTKVRKLHTSRRDAFESVNTSPMARIDDNTVTMLTDQYTRRGVKKNLVVKPSFDDKVALVKFYPNMNPKIIDWHIKNNYRGIILEGTGLGHVSNRLFQSLKNAINADIIVGMTSQCIWGRINMNVYATGRDLQNFGVIPLGDMLPETALVKLMWTLGQTEDKKTAKTLLTTNIAGEFSNRSLFKQKKGSRRPD